MNVCSHLCGPLAPSKGKLALRSLAVAYYYMSRSRERSRVTQKQRGFCSSGLLRYSNRPESRNGTAIVFIRNMNWEKNSWAQLGFEPRTARKLLSRSHKPKASIVPLDHWAANDGTCGDNVIQRHTRKVGGSTWGSPWLAPFLHFDKSMRL